jgi:Domain of unknown function (DUF4389)
MSETTYPDVDRHPIQLVITDDLRRNRLTVLVRLLLAIPHFIWLTIWGIAAGIAIIIAWFAALFLGRVPDGLHSFISGFIRYGTHVNAYFSIAANPFPAFTGAAGYPIDLEIAPAAPQNRLTVLARILLAIPAVIVLYILTIVARLVMILAWFYALFAGNLAKGLRDVLAYWLRYQAQTWGYLGLLTSRYPSFSDE